MSETRHERAERRIREYEGYLEQARNKPATMQELIKLLNRVMEVNEKNAEANRINAEANNRNALNIERLINLVPTHRHDRNECVIVHMKPTGSQDT